MSEVDFGPGETAGLELVVMAGDAILVDERPLRRFGCERARRLSVGDRSRQHQHASGYWNSSHQAPHPTTTWSSRYTIAVRFRPCIGFRNYIKPGYRCQGEEGTELKRAQ